MRYEKPEIFRLAPAVAAIQGSAKAGQSGDGPKPTPAAYEADE